MAGNQAAAERHAPLDDLSWYRSLARQAGTARGRLRHLRKMAEARPVADTPLVLRLPEEIADELLVALRAAQSQDVTPCRTFSIVADGRPVEVEQATRAEPQWGGTASSGNKGSLPAWMALLSLIEGFVNTWDHDNNDPRRPAAFRKAFIAWGWRCSAPGCTSRRLLQIHHVVYRSHGGGDEMENLAVLCLFHHLRGEHGEVAACRGRSPVAITWRLGPKATGTHYRNERRVSRHIPRGM